MKDFRSLKVWEKAHKFTLIIYQHTKNFPKDEIYGFTSQIRRSAGSIPTNIAEGCGRDNQVEFARFLTLAMGSASELKYQLIHAHDLKYADDHLYSDLSADLSEICRMLNVLIQKIKHDIDKKQIIAGS